MAWGCSVYQSSLLDDQAGSSSSGGTDANSAGAAGSRGGAGSASIAGTESRAGAASAEGGGVPMVGGTSSVAGAGDSGASDGGNAAGEGGAVACVPETTSEFCKRVGKDCGTVNGTSNCGSAVVAVSCGSCQGFKICGGDGRANVCGALTDPALGGVATASSVGSIGENGSKAFDLSVNTKWYGGDNNATGWLAYQFAGTTSHVVNAYSLTSANDVPERDPSTWQLQGSNDGGSWIKLDQRTAQSFPSRHQTASYTCGNTTAYRSYRLLITANNSAGSLQLAELVLYGK